MLVRLLLLKRLSPVLFWLKIAGLAAFIGLFLAFADECGYLILRQLDRMPPHPPVHSAMPR